MIAVLGLSFLWSSTGSAATMHFRHAVAGSASLIGSQWHSVVLAGFYALAVLAFAPAGRRAPSSPALTRRGAVLGATGLAGNLVLVSTPLAGGAVGATAFTLLGFTLSAAYVAGSVVCWMRALVSRGLQDAVLVTVASCALSYATQLVIDLAVGHNLLVYLVLCPLCCGACLALAASGTETVAAIHPAITSRATPTGGHSPAWRRLPWGRIVPVLALVYLEQALTGLLFQRYAAWPRDNLALTLGAGLAIWGGVLTIMLVRRTRSDDPTSAGGSRGFLVLSAALLVIYMAALLATVVVPVSDGPVVERLLVAAGSSFKTLLWIVLLASACAGTVSPLPAGCAYVLGVLAVPVSRLASLGFSYADPALVAALCSPTAVAALAAGALFAVAAGYVLANVRQEAPAPGSAEFPETTDRQKGAADDAGSRRERACAALARQAGLSPRETDVLALVCSGYSARHAGEQLGISESTVVSHVTHIYRKAGVSNRQQLVARVAQLKAHPDDIVKTCPR